MAMYYPDGPEYEIDLFDWVDVTLDGQVFDGQVTRLWPRLKMVTVVYIDHINTTKLGHTSHKSKRVPIAAVTLNRRDG